MKIAKITKRLCLGLAMSGFICGLALSAPKITHSTFLHSEPVATAESKIKPSEAKNIHQELKKLPVEKLTRNTKLYQVKNHQLLDTQDNIKKNALVKLMDVAHSKYNTYVQVQHQGKDLGWVNANDVAQTDHYMLPYQYTSQFWPSKAKDACEIASLKTALSSDNKAMYTPLNKMVNRIPLNPNPNLGYTGDPYHYGTHATINPDAMVKVAQKYGAHAKNISGAPITKFIQEVTHGNPVIYESPFLMKRPGSDHDLTILGYKPGYFYVVDPFAIYHSSRRSIWVSVQRFKELYYNVHRDQHAMVIYG